MSTVRLPAPIAVLFTLALNATIAPGQTAASSTELVPTQEETVTLSPFAVTSERIGRYQAAEAASASRVRVPILDSTQNISVVTRELMEDVSSDRILDVTKYIAGISESILPNAQDRTNIRGFQADGVTIDGFSFFSYGNLDSVLVDRVEVVKGPSAILAPQGTPGGTANIVTKRPGWKDKAYVSYQLGEFSANRGELDVNRVLIPNKLSMRVVGAGQRATDYPGNGNYHRSYVIMPEFTYRFSQDTELTLEIQAYDWRALNYLGIPIDPMVGTDDNVRLFPGISRTLNPYDAEVVRNQKGVNTRAFFTTNFSKAFATRVAANWWTSHGSSAQTNLGNPGTVKGVNYGNNNTGYYTADGSWHAGNVDGSPYTPSQYIGRSGATPPSEVRRNYDLQNDYVLKLDTKYAKTLTTFGFWLSQSFTYSHSYAPLTPKTPFLYNAYFPEATVAGPVLSMGKWINRTKQAYINENVSLFSDRIILNGSVARAYYQAHTNNYAFNNLTRRNDPKVTLPSYGVVIKPIPQISLFYGFSKQATPLGPNNSQTLAQEIAANNTAISRGETVQSSRQREEGIRFQLLDKRLYFSVAHFDIQQNNFSIPNPANLVIPAPVPPLPALFSDRIAKGWEYELRAQLTPSLSLIGNYTKYSNRTPIGQAFRGAAEQSGAAWVSYAFKEGPFKRLTVGAGAEYMGKRAGDNPAGPGTYNGVVVAVPQPTFWLPERTLFNASISYVVNSHWRTQLNVDNLLNKKYIAASISRHSVYPGPKMNARVTVRYDF